MDDWLEVLYARLRAGRKSCQLSSALATVLAMRSAAF